jgi:hypothetical protein
MIIVWQGWGILVPIIGAAIFVTVEAITGQVLGEGYMKTHAWPGMTACVLAALTYWRLGRWLEDDDRGNSFMFIPMRWWSYIAVAFGVFFLFKPQSQAPVSAREPASLRRSIPPTPTARPSGRATSTPPVEPTEPAPAESGEPAMPDLTPSPAPSTP